MRVFVTGAAGFIGQATVKELQAHGHTVLGLSRSEENATILRGLGADVIQGDLKDLDSLRRGARDADGVIHLAFVHDFANFAAACATGLAAMRAMAEVLEGTGKPFVHASGTLMCKKGQLATEDGPIEVEPPFDDRVKTDQLVYDISKRGVRGSVIRLAPTTYADGKGGLTRMMIDHYHANGGPVVIVGDGQSRWPTCYRDDAASLFRLALEKGRAGATYHAVAEGGVSMKDTFGMVAEKMKLPLKSLTPEEAKPMGMMAFMLTADNPSSSEKTRNELGWQPTGPKMLADFEAHFPF